jgi:hypothetical protein
MSTAAPPRKSDQTELRHTRAYRDTVIGGPR